MIIHNFHIAWAGRAIRPIKANAPLIVDPNAPLAFAVAFQFLQSVAREIADVLQTYRRPEPVQHALRSGPKRVELLDPFATREAFRPRIAIAQDHGPDIIDAYALRQA